MQSGAPQIVGLCPSDVDGCAALANRVMRRLIIDKKQPDEGWYGTNARMVFNVSRTNPYITTPREVARITALDVCKKPVRIYNEWYEFLDYSRGLRPTGCGDSGCCDNLNAFQRGDVGGSVVTAFDFKPPDKIVRIFPTNAADVGKKVVIQGKDAFGSPLISTDGVNTFQGQFIALEFPFVETSEQLSELTGIQKDLTVGEVVFMQVDTNTGDQSPLVTMQGGEQLAAYARVFLNGLPRGCCESKTGISQVVAMCKLDFVPVRVTTDLLIIGCIEALVEETQSIRYSGIDSDRAKKMQAFHHSNAIDFLGGELDHYVGKERVSIGVKIFGSDKMLPSFS